VTGWCGLARIVRSEVRQIRSSEYVLAAQCMGSGFFHIMIKHLIPNFISTIMFVVVSSIGLSISMESTLSFLGLGLPVDVVSWGSMLSLANKALLSNSWWVIIFPGVFLITTLVCVTNIAYYFRKETNKRESYL
jgi:peptide/nickel transport system permease protein